MTTPLAAAREAALLVKAHQCVDCRALPLRPFDSADEEVEVEYRPKAPRPIAGGGPRSARCRTHLRAQERRRKSAQRATHKARRFGLAAELQQALWEFQGRACPCGRKRAEQVPPGVTLDHDHALAKLHSHPAEDGCPSCVTGFVCRHCNVDIIGRLEGAFRGDRETVATALFSLANHLIDPPLRRLLATRPELLESAA